MNVKPPRLGELIAGVAGLVLLVSLFFGWYGALSAWEAFAVADVVLIVAAVAGLALLVIESTQRTPAVAVAWAALTFIVTLVALAMVAYRVLDAPGAAEGLATRPFAFVGLAATAAVVAGALLSMRDDRVHPEGGATSPPDTVRLPHPQGAGEARP